MCDVIVSRGAGPNYQQRRSWKPSTIHFDEFTSGTGCKAVGKADSQSVTVDEKDDDETISGVDSSSVSML
jgi:hypothetical protein